MGPKQTMFFKFTISSTAFKPNFTFGNLPALSFTLSIINISIVSLQIFVLILSSNKLMFPIRPGKSLAILVDQ